MTRNLSTLAVLLVLVLLVASCGGKSQPETAQSTAPQATQAPAQSAAPQATRAEATAPTAAPPTVAPEPTSTADAPDRSEGRAALDGLDSYVSTFIMTYLGTDPDGNAIDERVEIGHEYTRDPLARHFVALYRYGSEPDPDEDRFEYYQIENEGFIYADEEEGWMSVSVDNPPFGIGSLMQMGEAAMFGDPAEMRRVQPDETVNGIVSRHYQFDEGMLDESLAENTGKLTAQGDLWVAVDGGYVTKYRLVIEISDGQGGAVHPDMAEGVIEMDFVMQEVNSDLVIDTTVAASFGSSVAGDGSAGSALDRTWVGGFAQGEFPLPQGTRFQLQSRELLIIESDLSASELAAFYDEALAGLGWIRNADDSLAMGDMTIQIYDKAGERLQVMLNKDANTGKTIVTVSGE